MKEHVMSVVRFFTMSKKRKILTLVLLGVVLIVGGLYQLGEVLLPEQWDIVAIHSDDPEQVRVAVIMLGGEYAESKRNNPELEKVFKKVRERTGAKMMQTVKKTDLKPYEQWKEVWHALNVATGTKEPLPVGYVQLGGR